MKRIVRLFILIVFIGGGVYTYYHFFKAKNAIQVDHLQYLSNDAAIVVQFHNKEELIKGIEVLELISNAQCKPQLPEQIMAMTNREDFIKGSMAIVDCNQNAMEILLQTTGSVSFPTIDGWSVSKTGQRNLSKLLNSHSWEFSSSPISLNENEEAYFVGEDQLRLVVVHDNAKWIDQANRFFSEKSKYTVYEVEVAQGHIHLNGFSIPIQIIQDKPSLKIQRTFTSILPESFDSFSWTMLNDQNELGAMEALSVYHEQSAGIYALRVDFNKESTLALTNSASGLINEFPNTETINSYFHMEIEPLRYFSLFKDWLICSNDKAVLADYGKKVKANKLWSNTQNYGSFMTHLSMDATAIKYYDNDNNGQFISQWSGNEHTARYSVIDVLQSGANMMALTSPPIEFSEPAIVDAANTDDYFEFTNHYTGEKELLFQDEDMNLVLMSKQNEVIFKRKISEEVIGNFKVVDALKNNKYQIAFNTRNFIYIIDRKGRDLENFPIELSDEASNELAVVDYDDNRNYRLFLGLENGEIVNYTVGGKKVRGWDYKNSDTPVIYPITHLRLGNKDYLFALNDSYEIQLLDRKGQIRHPLETQPEGLNNIAFEIIQNDNIQNSGIRYSNPEGERVDFLFGKTAS